MNPADFAAAREQMEITLGFHIVLASIGIGLPALTLLAEWRSQRTGDPAYTALAHRWAKATGVLFAVGAVSGTVLSFEFGTLWPRFMSTYGQVFGTAFALEGIAFFIEAIFIGIYLYGWDRLSPRAHLLSGVPIVVSGLLSAFFVVTVNAWMNQPRGFRLVGGHAVDVRPLTAMFNPATPPEAVHLILASLMVCGFIVASVYAVAILRGRDDRYHRLGFAIPFTLAAVVTPFQLIVGDWAARFVSAKQPVKFAAMEDIARTRAGVPLKLPGLEIPDGLSLLLRFDPHATLQGLDSVAPADRPSTPVVHTAFDLMVALGTLLLALSAWWALMLARPTEAGVSRTLSANGAGNATGQRWFFRGAAVAGVAAVVAMWAGWTVTEVGRQPWIVYGYMRTVDALNPSGGLRYGMYVVSVVYAVLIALTIAVLRRMRVTR
jgi:cytochrome bd ubiquinol oxidase subunit I